MPLTAQVFVYSCVLLVCLGPPKGRVLLGLTCTVPSAGKWSIGNRKQTWESFQHLGEVIAVELLSWFPWRWSLLTVFGTEACGKSSMLMCSVTKEAEGHCSDLQWGWTLMQRVKSSLMFLCWFFFFFSKCQVPLARQGGNEATSEWLQS